MRALSPRERRLVAVLILVAAIALVARLVVLPITDGFGDRANRKRELTLQYEHNVRAIAVVPRLRRAAERERATTRPFAVTVANVETGRELLKERLQRAVEGAGGEFRTADDGEGRPGWVRASAVARLTLPQLVATLADLQNQPPWLVVETLNVGADEALVTGREAAMDVQIDASIPFRAPAAR